MMIRTWLGSVSALPRSRESRSRVGRSLGAIALGTTLALGGIAPPMLASPAPLRTTRQEDALQRMGLDDQLFGPNGDRGNLIRSIDHSLRYLRTPAAFEAYRGYPVAGVTRERVDRSLRRFRELVIAARSAQELRAAVQREFVLYESIGRDNQGEVYFTAYYEPIYAASRTPTAEYRYPLYREPANLASWPTPLPEREVLEGKDGRGTASPLQGQELVWLRDRLEAFLVHIQGSARLQLTDGSVMTVGYAGHNGYGYHSVGSELAKDGKLPLNGLTLPVMIDYFKRNPQELDNYLPRNPRFIFFRETHGAPATGNLNVPVTPERSIATDRALMPPGALALIQGSFPYPSGNGELAYRNVNRFVLDQDTGSAMIGPGRVDYFMGTGPLAGARAGIVGSRGRMYYLLLR